VRETSQIKTKGKKRENSTIKIQNHLCVAKVTRVAFGSVGAKYPSAAARPRSRLDVGGALHAPKLNHMFVEASRLSSSVSSQKIPLPGGGFCFAECHGFESQPATEEFPLEKFHPLQLSFFLGLLFIPSLETEACQKWGQPTTCSPWLRFKHPGAAVFESRKKKSSS